MVYEYNSQIYLAEVALNVTDLESQTAFYHQLLGLEILNQSENQVLLGAGGKPLVRLIKTDDISNPKQSYGLYHMALLLPTREDLANVFKHLLDLKIPLVGGADHGYSEAIYLEDLESNGIELYRDKPEAEWDIREDGRIIGGHRRVVCPRYLPTRKRNRAFCNCKWDSHGPCSPICEE